MYVEQSQEVYREADYFKQDSVDKHFILYILEKCEGNHGCEWYQGVGRPTYDSPPAHLPGYCTFTGM